MASLVLYGSKQDWHVWKVLVTAKYANAKITLEEDFDKKAIAAAEARYKVVQLLSSSKAKNNSKMLLFKAHT